jgi:hypothetical protein
VVGGVSEWNLAKCTLKSKLCEVRKDVGIIIRRIEIQADREGRAGRTFELFQGRQRIVVAAVRRYQDQILCASW